MTKIKIQNLTKIYEHPKIKGVNTAVLSGIDAEFHSGIPSVIKGVSGSGKTTFFKVLRGMEKFDAGEIYLDNRIVITKDGTLTTNFIQSIAYMDQFPENILQFRLTPLENIIFLHRLYLNSKKDEALRVANELLEFFELNNIKNNSLKTLSGGELQRLAISKILSINSKIVLCDEPTSNLDRDNKKLIIQLLKNFGVENERIIIVNTHDDYVSFGGKIYELTGGRIY